MANSAEHKVAIKMEDFDTGCSNTIIFHSHSSFLSYITGRQILVAQFIIVEAYFCQKY
jgi:hypothetical protein